MAPLAIGYGRNSRLAGRQRGENNSIDEQRRVIPGVASSNGFELHPVGIIEEEDTSGSTFLRPGWQEAVSMVASGEVQAIVAYDLDRISRAHAAETWLAIAEIEDLGGRVFDRSGPLSVSDQNSEIVTMIRAMMNRTEWRKRKDMNETSVRKAIVEKGAHLTAPFGYEKKEKGDPLSIVPREAKIVRRIFKLRAEGQSWSRIARWLNSQPVKPRIRKRHGETYQPTWSAAHLSQIVKNEVYLGTAWNGPHRFPGAHPAIVGADQFAAANKVRGRKFAEKNAGHLLSGLVRCASCGYVMSSTRKAASSGGARYYKCQRGKDGCPAPISVPAEAMEALAVERFRSLVADLAEYEPVAGDEALQQALEVESEAKAVLSLKLDRFSTLDASPEEQEIIDQQLGEAREALRLASIEVEEAKRATLNSDLPIDLDADTFETMEVEQRRHLLGLVFAAFVVRKSLVWREDVALRTRVLRRDEAPSSSTALIPFAAGLDW